MEEDDETIMFYDRRDRETGGIGDRRENAEGSGVNLLRESECFGSKENEKL